MIRKTFFSGPGHKKRYFWFLSTFLKLLSYIYYLWLLIYAKYFFLPFFQMMKFCKFSSLKRSKYCKFDNSRNRINMEHEILFEKNTNLPLATFNRVNVNEHFSTKNHFSVKKWALLYCNISSLLWFKFYAKQLELAYSWYEHSFSQELFLSTVFFGIFIVKHYINAYFLIVVGEFSSFLNNQKIVREE